MEIEDQIAKVLRIAPCGTRLAFRMPINLPRTLVSIKLQRPFRVGEILVVGLEVRKSRAHSYISLRFTSAGVAMALIAVLDKSGGVPVQGGLKAYLFDDVEFTSTSLLDGSFRARHDAARVHETWWPQSLRGFIVDYHSIGYRSLAWGDSSITAPLSDSLWRYFVNTYDLECYTRSIQLTREYQDLPESRQTPERYHQYLREVAEVQWADGLKFWAQHQLDCIFEGIFPELEWGGVLAFARKNGDVLDELVAKPEYPLEKIPLYIDWKENPANEGKSALYFAEQVWRPLAARQGVSLSRLRERDARGVRAVTTICSQAGGETFADLWRKWGGEVRHSGRHVPWRPRRRKRPANTPECE